VSGVSREKCDVAHPEGMIPQKVDTGFCKKILLDQEPKARWRLNLTAALLALSDRSPSLILFALVPR
jgi:hypothetical protein